MLATLVSSLPSVSFKLQNYLINPRRIRKQAQKQDSEILTDKAKTQKKLCLTKTLFLTPCKMFSCTEYTQNTLGSWFVFFKNKDLVSIIQIQGNRIFFILFLCVIPVEPLIIFVTSS